MTALGIRWYLCGVPPSRRRQFGSVVGPSDTLNLESLISDYSFSKATVMYGTLVSSQGALARCHSPNAWPDSPEQQSALGLAMLTSEVMLLESDLRAWIRHQVVLAFPEKLSHHGMISSIHEALFYIRVWLM